MSTLQTIDHYARAAETGDPEPLMAAEVTAGAGTLEQKSWNLARPVTLIGSSRHVHIRVEGVGVEAVHAALLNTGDAIVLADLASRQGVFHGGQKVRTRVMQPGDSLRLGACVLRLGLDAGAAGRERPDPDLAVRLPAPVQLRMEHGGTGEWTVGTIGAVIGSRPGCDVRLASREVLPLQAVLTRAGRQVVLASLAVDRAIRVNGTPMSVAIVNSADTLTIWPVTLRMMIGGPEAAPQ